jgi:hypothetical protein
MTAIGPIACRSEAISMAARRLECIANRPHVFLLGYHARVLEAL